MSSMSKPAYATLAIPVLRAAQEQGRTITYGELAREIGYPHAIWHEEFGTILGIVALEDAALAAVAVNKKTGRPGPGYYRWLEMAGIPVPEAAA